MASDILLPPGLKVLLVEDEPLLAIDGEAILKSAGVDQVVCVRTVAEGLMVLDLKPFHAAFLDLRLGLESSLPLAQRLTSLGVPFAFLTGFQSDAIPEEFRHCPVLAKPYAPEELGRLMQRLVVDQ